MAKYSDKFKIMIVKEYLEGRLGYCALAKKYNIPSFTSIEGWVKNYQYFGKKGIESKSKKSNFSVKFKLDVLKYKKSIGSSYTETALRFGLSNPSTIANWNTTFLKKGVDGLSNTLGRPCKMKKKDKSKNKSETELEKLTRENEMLRLEVSYLKKVSAFLEKQEKSQERHKQKSPTNCTKKDSD